MLLLIGVFLTLSLPLALSTRVTNYTSDEETFHYPNVLKISEHWPRLDLANDSLSAISPGYHYLLAGVHKLFGLGLMPLRLIHLVASLTFIAVLFLIFPNEAPWTRCAAILPLIFSNFFVKSSAYITTDNPALFMVAISLIILWGFPTTTKWFVLASASISIAIFFRQLCIWLLAPLSLRAFEQYKARHARWVWVLLVPPLAVLGCLVYTWGGLVPPSWQETSITDTLFVPAAGAYLLSVLALLSPAFLATLRTQSLTDNSSRKIMTLGATIGLIFAVLGPTDLNWAEGRWGGFLWNLSAHLPHIADRSLLFLVLAPIGGMLLALLTKKLREFTSQRIALAWILTFLSWASTCLINRQVFHRYYEPPILLFLLFWMLLLLRQPRFTAPSTHRLWPLYLLAMVQWLITISTAHYATFWT